MALRVQDQHRPRREIRGLFGRAASVDNVQPGAALVLPPIGHRNEGRLRLCQIVDPHEVRVLGLELAEPGHIQQNKLRGELLPRGLWRVCAAEVRAVDVGGRVAVPVAGCLGAAADVKVDLGCEIQGGPRIKKTKHTRTLVT